MSITYTIDGVNVTAEPSDTILTSATRAGVEIPTLCFDARTAIYGACGICLVEVEGVPKLLRACSARPQEGYVVHTDSPRVERARKTALELLLSDHTGDCRGPCKLNCPALTDCQKYVGEIREGRYKDAVSTIYQAFPFPASIGHVCPHPCEDACRRQMVEEPLSIAFLKAFAADKIEADGDPYVVQCEPSTGKHVAIVGGGPAGLTAAYFLRRYGHDVTIYDKQPKMGGMLRYGIPEYRLPKAVLDREIKIIADAGVQMINDVRLGKDLDFDDLRQRYDAVLLALGAWKSYNMRVPGEDLEGVIGGIEFLEQLGLGERPTIGERVAVCGGGNTAMDCCRTAVRLGAKEVYVVYRRTRAEMPASDVEIDEAEEEGVTFKYLTNPIEFYGKDGRLTGMKLQIMELGEPDASGRRRPVPVEGATEDIAIDNVLMAIGQGANCEGVDGELLTQRGTIACDDMTFRTAIDNVFAAGDVTNRGAGIAIEAIAEAQKAAFCINNYLEGDEVRRKIPYFVTQEVTPEEFEDRPKQNREKMPGLSPEERRGNFDPIYFGFSEEQALREASRCLECGCHDYYDCRLIRFANAFDIDPDRFAGIKHDREEVPVVSEVIVHDPDKCVLCGLCYRMCEQEVGKTFLGLYNRGFSTVVNPMVPKEAREFCASCLKCVEACPTGAMKSVPAVERVTQIV
ncbi:MAG: FAD-dependent oxidoreductase [Atopobiaceae bacterium]|nr:FAD-dependent oxidoreductase [Atopobiaceae bacterium]